MNKLGYIYILMLLIGILSPANAQRERIGMSDDLNFIIVGIDGYYTDGREQYYRIGDYLVVRGSVSGPAESVSIKVVAPDGSIWYSNNVRLGYAKGYSYYVMDDGIRGKEWGSDNGFYAKVKQFSADDLEGLYRLIIEADSSIIEREVAFKRVEGSYSNEIGAVVGSDALNGRYWDGIERGVAVATIVGVTLVVVTSIVLVRRRKRIKSSNRKEVASI